MHFDSGEPICTVVPVVRGFLEQFEPIIAPLHTNAELHEEYRHWEISRAGFNAAVDARISQALTSGWQKHYTRGLMPGGAALPSIKPVCVSRSSSGWTEVRPDNPRRPDNADNGKRFGASLAIPPVRPPGGS